MPGPIPKRSDQRRRNNKGPAITSMVSGRAIPVPEPDAGWHELARDWFVSLGESGERAFFEPSDWATARIWAELLSRQLKSERISAVMIQAWGSAAAELLTTEGARRRVRIELDRGGRDEDEEHADEVLNVLYAQFTKPKEPGAP